jgi:hypothetical protein
VSSWSAQALTFPVQELALKDVGDDALASLIELRLRLERAHGWWLMGAMAGALLSVVVVGVVVGSSVVFGAYAAAVASGTVLLGVGAQWAQEAVFRRQAMLAGLSHDAAHRLFRAAADADHWIGVLRGCGQAPSPAELASFVRDVDLADPKR